MTVVDLIREAASNSIKQVFALDMPVSEVLVSDTKPEFEGDYTLVTFNLTKALGKKPEEIGQLLGEDLMKQNEFIDSFNVIKGFLNLSINTSFYANYVHDHYTQTTYTLPSKNKKVMIEYSSPNTNKPLHFGHLRNIFLGAAIANIYSKNGYEVIKANLINDRGIHICKSMVAWKKLANGATPESTQIKGDHLVGDYYVAFNNEYKKEVAALMAAGESEEEAEKKAPILLEAQDMLRRWEAHEEETIQLWKTMNDWVYAGFKKTYALLGVDFHQYYYESETYLLGKHLIEKGLQDGVLFKKEDKSVWIDLTEDGLDQKLLLRGDGTSVYITQDIGTVDLKYTQHGLDSSVYVVGDEQNYHFQVLKLIMQKLHHPGAAGIHHLSYGMVELPSGKMKSREGTVVDADDMIAEMNAIAKTNTEELGKIDGFTETELQQLYHTIGMGALKFYLLRVDPKKRMIFNPKESIDFHGFTGPFVQYTHARISSILRKSGDENISMHSGYSMNPVEKKLVRLAEQYTQALQQSCTEYNAAVLCNYLFQLAKDYNSFLPQHPILRAETDDARIFRIQLSMLVKHILADGLLALGIESPERM